MRSKPHISVRRTLLLVVTVALAAAAGAGAVYATHTFTNADGNILACVNDSRGVISVIVDATEPCNPDREVMVELALRGGRVATADNADNADLLDGIDSTGFANAAAVRAKMLTLTAADFEEADILTVPGFGVLKGQCTSTQWHLEFRNTSSGNLEAATETTFREIAPFTGDFADTVLMSGDAPALFVWQLGEVVGIPPEDGAPNVASSAGRVLTITASADHHASPTDLRHRVCSFQAQAVVSE